MNASESTGGYIDAAAKVSEKFRAASIGSCVRQWFRSIAYSHGSIRPCSQTKRLGALTGKTTISSACFIHVCTKYGHVHKERRFEREKAVFVTPQQPASKHF